MKGTNYSIYRRERRGRCDKGPRDTNPQIREPHHSTFLKSANTNIIVVQTIKPSTENLELPSRGTLKNEDIEYNTKLTMNWNLMKRCHQPLSKLLSCGVWKKLILIFPLMLIKHLAI